MTTDNLKLYEERMKRLNDAVELKIPDRVPILSIADNWALGYYGTTLQKAQKT